MTQIYLTVLFVLFLVSANLYPQASLGTGSSFYYVGNDSLLFDGEGENSHTFQNAENCTVKILSVSGLARGTRYVFKKSTCGKDLEETTKKGQIFPDDRLVPGDSISTGSNGYLTILLSDGKTIRFAHNTNIVINDNYCLNNFKTQVVLGDGEIFVNAKPNKEVKGINVTTQYGSAIIEGTELQPVSLKTAM